MFPEDQPAGDVPLSPAIAETHTAVADSVVATYVAEAVRTLPGVVELHGSAWQEMSERVRVDVPTKGIAVRAITPGVIEIDAHVRVAWGARIPGLAHAFQEAVRTNMRSLLDLEVRRATLFVDEIAPPPEIS